ncbi:MAG: formimidoylglutamate deiminase [Crocinitomicaceae bacterium]|nr:formimidoylglutamate deiminase [Crocinitomicaceae bacterium]
MNEFAFKGMLQKEGWIDNVTVKTDDTGIIISIDSENKSKTAHSGFAIPGFQNAHSHAFQYAMAGLAELHSVTEAQNDFWSWRKTMYQLALHITPEQMEHIATLLYKEMLRNGYTQVAEFHYLHHNANGKPYAHLAEMSERIMAGAQNAGIKITLIPIFYQKGGFGKEPEKDQRRFISNSIDDYSKLFEACEISAAKFNDASVGYGIHSMRAVTSENIIRLSKLKKENTPLHIHVSEQLKEIEECQSFLGKRPVEWLSNNIELNEDYHLVHATHLIEKEIEQIASSGASVVLCPSTEGNLGDGLFPLGEFLRKKGKWSIGTDSHIGINPLEEIRILDYGQRLITHSRNTFGNQNSADNGQIAIESALLNGRKAMGIDQKTFFEIGKPLDALVLSSTHPLLQSASSKNRSNTIIYAGDSSIFNGTIVNGKWVIENGCHKDPKIDFNFIKTMKELKVR